MRKIANRIGYFCSTTLPFWYRRRVAKILRALRKIGILFVTAASIGVAGTASALEPNALPTGERIVAGTGTVSRDNNRLQVDQQTSKLIVNWDSFNIGANAQVNFVQPSASAVALNRVLGTDTSQIFGRLTANGQVFLINPNGVLFGDGARVDVGGLVASTLNIGDGDFLAGRYHFQQEAAGGSVVNRGEINAADGGYIALLAPDVRNEGVLTARLGTVALGAGQQMTLDMGGDGLLRLAVDEAVVNAYVANRHLIRADGGRVIMSASASDALTDTVVNMDGVVQAQSLAERNGEIYLDGGANGIVDVRGTLDASGREPGQTGGTVAVVGNKVGLFDAARIDVTGDVGGGSVRIGGDFQGHGPAPNAERTYIGKDATINADALTHGNGGDVVVWADNSTRFFGHISARGGSQGGNGGRAEVSGKEELLFRGLVDLRADNGTIGTLLLDPKNITIATGGLDTVTTNDAFAENSTTSVTFSPLSVVAQLDLANVTLQANNDITVSNAVSALGLLSNNSLTLQAGRSITINADISLRGAFTATVNDSAAQAANRDAGAATFTMASGTTISTATNNNNINITMSTGPGGTTSGDITLASLNAGSGHILVTNNGATAGSGIVRAGSSDLITASSAAFDVSGAGGGGEIGTSAAPVRVTVTNLEARGQSGGIFFLSPTQGVTVGGATLGGFTGISTSSNGEVSVQTTAGAITVNEAISANGSGNVTLTAGGGANAITLNDAVGSGSGSVVLSAANGVTLSGASADVTTTGSYTVNADSDASGAGTYTQDNAGSAVSVGAVTITAADVSLTGTIASGAANVTLQPSTTTATIGVGDTTKNFGVSSAEIGQITTTGTLTIGVSSNTGGTTVGTSEAVSAGSKNVALVTAGNLAVNSSNGISTTGNLTLSADTMALNGGTVSGANITLQPVTTSQTIALNDATGSLSLSTAELQSLSSTGTVTIGASGGTGAIRVGSLGAIDLSGESFSLTPRGGAVTFTNGITLPNDSTFTLNTAGITGSGGTDVTIGGSNGTLVLNATDAVSLTTNLRHLNATSVGGNLTVSNTGALDLGASSVTGNLNLTTSGTVTDSGTISVTGTTSLTAGSGNNITLDSAANDFGGAVSLVSGNNVILVDTNAIDLGASTVSGNLDVTAAGAITDSGTLVVTGTTNLAAGSGNNITLDSAANNFIGAVSIVSGNNIALVDTNAIDLGASTVSGSLNVTAAGAITDSGTLAVTGTATLAAGSANNITLDSAANNFSTVAITSGNNVTLVDTNALDLGASTVSGNLNITTGGALADSGTVVVTGTTSLTAGSSNNITLDSGTNNFVGAVSIVSGNNVTLVDTNAIDLGASTVSGVLNITAGGAITDSGALTVSGTTTLAAGSGNNITLDTGTNNFSTVAVTSGNNVTLVDTNAVDLGASMVSGDLSVTTAGAITDSGTLVVAGTATLAAGSGNNITLDSAANNFGTVAITSGNNVTLVDTNALNLGASTVSGNLNITTNGALTDSGTVAVTGTTSLTAGSGNNITLDSAANNFVGAVSAISGNNVTLVDTNTIDLGASTVSGTLNVTANGAITDSGTLAVTGTATFAAGSGNNITLDSAANNFSTVAITSANNVTLVDANAIDLGASTVSGNLSVSAAGAITDSGTIAVTGTTTLAAGSGNNITLDTGTNNFTGAVSITSGNNVTLVDTNAIDLGASTVSGALNVTAGGAITDSGTVTVTGTTTLAAGSGNDIALNSVANDFSTVAITSGNNATLVDANAIDLGTSTVSGALNVTSAGTITDSGTLAVTGTTTLAAGSTNNITLNSAANNFSTVAVTSGNNVTLVDTNAIDLGASTVAGALNVTAGGAITDSGTLVVTGTTTLAAGSGSNITLDSAANNFSTVAITSSNNVTLVDTNALDLGASTVSGNLNITTGGALTDSGTVAVTGTTSLTAGSSNNITLDSGANNFGGAVSVVSGNNVTLVDTNAVDLGASTISGNLNVTAGGALTDSGVLTVSGTTTLAAGSNNITLDSAANNFSTVTISSGNNVVLVDTNAIDLGASNISGNLTVTAGGTVTDSGNSTIGGTTNISATGGASIVLNNASTYTGAVSLAASGSGDVTLTNAAGNLTLAVISGDDVNLAAAGSILDSNGATTNITAGSSIALTATAGTVGTTADAIEISTPTVSISAGGIDGAVSANLAGTVSNNTVGILNVPSGQVLLNGVSITLPTPTPSATSSVDQTINQLGAIASTTQLLYGTDDEVMKLPALSTAHGVRAIAYSTDRGSTRMTRGCQGSRIVDRTTRLERAGMMLPVGVEQVAQRQDGFRSEREGQSEDEAERWKCR